MRGKVLLCLGNTTFLTKLCRNFARLPASICDNQVDCISMQLWIPSRSCLGAWLQMPMVQVHQTTFKPLPRPQLRVCHRWIPQPPLASPFQLPEGEACHLSGMPQTACQTQLTCRVSFEALWSKMEFGCWTVSAWSTPFPTTSDHCPSCKSFVGDNDHCISNA